MTSMVPILKRKLSSAILHCRAVLQTSQVLCKCDWKNEKTSTVTTTILHGMAWHDMIVLKSAFKNISNFLNYPSAQLISAQTKHGMQRKRKKMITLLLLWQHHGMALLQTLECIRTLHASHVYRIWNSNLALIKTIRKQQTPNYPTKNAVHWWIEVWHSGDFQQPTSS